MPKPRTSPKWFVVVVFFLFMLLHQADKLLIGPLTPDIIDTFKISYTQMGAVTTGALIVGAVFYPLWGWLYDRFSRAKLISLASFLWGATTWLGAIAPTYGTFVGARAATGIDDSSYPGLYSLIADYFPPRVRGKVYGVLQLAQPIGYLVGMVLALMLGGAIGWRNVFFITGGLGVVLAAAIFFGVREPERGGAEPELAGVEDLTRFKFSWQEVRGLFRKRSLVLLFAQGFFGVFPWNVITYWFFVYLEKERGYASDSILFTMAPAVLVLAAGYPLAGALGDWLFRKTLRGRVLTALLGVFMGMVLLFLTVSTPVGQEGRFFALLVAAAIFIPFGAPNVLSSVYDMTPPEVRSSANAVQNFIEFGGSALAPLMAGIIADATSLGTAILVICTSAWALCVVFLALAARIIPADILALRAQLAQRAEQAQ